MIAQYLGDVNLASTHCIISISCVDLNNKLSNISPLINGCLQVIDVRELGCEDVSSHCDVQNLCRGAACKSQAQEVSSIDCIEAQLGNTDLILCRDLPTIYICCFCGCVFVSIDFYCPTDLITIFFLVFLSQEQNIYVHNI